MNFDSIKELENLKEQWNEYNGQRIEIESLIRQTFKERLVEHYEQAKEDFKQYFIKKGLTITENRLFITAAFNEFKIQMSLGEPTTQTKFEFELAKIQSQRIVFRVVIMPQDNFYYPAINLLRSMPESKDQLKLDISKMINESVNMMDLQKKIKENSFVFSCYRSDNPDPNYETITRFNSFSSVLGILFNE